MKRYLAFWSDVYYPCGGMNDFLIDCDTVDECIAAIKEKIDTFSGRANIYDTQLRKEVWTEKNLNKDG